MATIDLTLDALKIPNINGTFPFGKKITQTELNHGGLSTTEVNSNVMLPFTQMRPKVCDENSDTSQVEYDAKVVFNAPAGTTPSAGYTLTMGVGTYVGCTVTYTNLMEHACTVKQGDGTTTLFSIPAGKTMSAMWTGTAWRWTTSGTVSANDPTPVSSAAVQSAIAELKDRVVETYQAEQITVTQDTNWELSGSKPGYFPISVEPFNEWSGSVVTSPENIVHSNGSFYIQGFASAVFSASSAFVAKATVVWVKI